MKKTIEIIKTISVVLWILFIVYWIYSSYLDKNKKWMGYTSLGQCVVTAYEASEVSCGSSADGKTSINLPVSRGIVAVDPRQIPIGSTIFILDNEPNQALSVTGYYLCADVGAAITNKRIDIFMHSLSQCNRFGRKKLKAWIVNLK